MTQMNRNVSSKDSYNHPRDVEEIFRTSDDREGYGSGPYDIEVIVLT